MALKCWICGGEDELSEVHLGQYGMLKQEMQKGVEATEPLYTILHLTFLVHLFTLHLLNIQMFKNCFFLQLCVSCFFWW